MHEIKNYRRTAEGVWTGRVDDEFDIDAFRFHQAIGLGDLNNMVPSNNLDLRFALLGFCSDEGVKRNMGRVGAVEGPLAIRKELAKLPANFLGTAEVIDFGDVLCVDGNLEQAQSDLSEAVQVVLNEGMMPIVLGGGHEIVYGHYSGLREYEIYQKRSAPILINLDAHLDLRSFEKGGTSGTSFFQIASEHVDRKLPFEYICLGTQTYGNTKRLYKRAEELGVTVIDSKDISEHTKDRVINQVLERIGTNESIYLTLDMDVLNAANAPGVSSPQPFGMDPELFMFLVRSIISTGKVKSIDVAEVAPRYDSDLQTAKLAAVIIYSVLNQLIKNL